MRSSMLFSGEIYTTLAKILHSLLVLGCTGLYWAVLGCIGLYWDVLGWIRLY